MKRIVSNSADIQSVKAGEIKLSPEAIVPNGKTFPNVDLHRGVIPNEVISEASTHKNWEQSDPFPVDCLPDTMRDVVNEVSRFERTNPAMAAMCALGVVSSSVGANLRIDSLPGKRSSGNLYLLCFAESAAGKSSICDRVLKPLTDFQHGLYTKWSKNERPRVLAEIDLNEAAIARILTKLRSPKTNDDLDAYRKQLIELKVRLAELELKRCGPSLVVENATSEAVVQVLSQNGGVVSSISSDAREAINITCGSYRKRGATDDALFLKGFSLEPYLINRVQRDQISLPSVCINVLWFVQPDKLDQLFSNHALSEGGLLPRFLMMRTDSLPGAIDRSIDPNGGEATTRWEKLVTDLLSAFRMSKQAFVLRPTDDARFILDKHFDGLLIRRGGNLKQLGSFVARWNEFAWRMSIVLHAARWGADACNHEVDLTTASAAIKIVEWFGRRQLEILSEFLHTASTTPESRVLALAHASTDGFTATDVRRKRITTNAAQAHDLLERMVADGKLAILAETKPEGGGHVTRRYVLANLEPKGGPA